MQEAKEVSVLPSVLFDVVVTWKTNDRPSRFPNFENEDGGGGGGRRSIGVSNTRPEPMPPRHTLHLFYSLIVRLLILLLLLLLYFFFLLLLLFFVARLDPSHAWKVLERAISKTIDYRRDNE